MDLALYNIIITIIIIPFSHAFASQFGLANSHGGDRLSQTAKKQLVKTATRVDNLINGLKHMV